jgi:hypothetical protein
MLKLLPSLRCCEAGWRSKANRSNTSSSGLSLYRTIGFGAMVNSNEDALVLEM